MYVKNFSGYIPGDSLSVTEKGLLDTFTPVTTQSTLRKYWKVILDPRLCPNCLKRYGKLFAVDEIPLMLPPEVPPLHENCRCDIIPMEAIIPGGATKNGLDGADFWLANRGRLPDYYISEDELRALGWRHGKRIAKYAPGKMLYGGIYDNKDGHLPSAPGRIWYEADINYYNGYRNGHRILFSSDGLIFVTYDHYKTFYEVKLGD